MGWGCFLWVSPFFVQEEEAWGGRLVSPANLGHNPVVCLRLFLKPSWEVNQQRHNPDFSHRGQGLWANPWLMRISCCTFAWHVNLKLFLLCFLRDGASEPRAPGDKILTYWHVQACSLAPLIMSTSTCYGAFSGPCIWPFLSLGSYDTSPRLPAPTFSLFVSRGR